MKNGKQLEKFVKGAANHRRIDILFLLHNEGEATLDSLTARLGCSFPAISVHTKNLVNAGLIYKKYQGRFVLHSLSDRGRMFVKFLKTL